MKTTKVYPASCTSAFCGRLSCDGCPNKEKLDEFKKWVEETNAKVTDPIWCPLVYEGRER